MLGPDKDQIKALKEEQKGLRGSKWTPIPHHPGQRLGTSDRA